MNQVGTRTLVALALQLAALGVLALALLGTSWLDPSSRPRRLVLVDRSQSVPRAAADKALADIVRAAQAAGGGDLQVLEFAGAPSTPPTPSTATAGAAAALETSTTNIEAALDAALAAHAQAALAGVVMISDGLENRGDAARALRAMREAQLPLQWVAVGRAPPRTRIAEVLAPSRALVGQRIQVTVQLAGQLDAPLRVKATARSPNGETRVASREVQGADRLTIELDAGPTGATLVDLALEDAASGQTIDALPDAAVVDIAPRAALLYAQGAGGSLASSLRSGGWNLAVVPAARLDAHADALAGYQAVVLDDVALSDASPRFWSALVAAVQNRGLGLLVLGGERSFARGGYRGSALEAILPVASEPAALDQPASVVFLVDKSGSMGRGSAGVDRFALAQRAVLETARGLGERDSLGLVVFDVAPRVLIPLGPAPAGTLALARDWLASPNGGTRLAPALEAAIGELERSGAARRLLILVTDGFLDDAPLAGLRARLARSRIETIALAVGPDADAGALERLVGTDAGLVFRVNEAAELPQVMRSGLERRRSRIARGTIAVEQPRPLPFSPGMLKDWPAIAAHAVTRPQAQAVVAVQSERGEPLIAFQTAGRGRVVAVTSGLGRWTPQWLAWQGWPGLAGGLADWVSGNAQGPTVGLTVADLPSRMQIVADIPAGTGGPGPDGVSIAVDTPTAQGLRVSADPVAPGRWVATLPGAEAGPGPGLYTFLVTTPQGTQRQLHLRRHRAENEAWGTNPALDAWRSAGLIQDGPAGLRAQVSVGAQGNGPQRRPPDRPLDLSLIGLGLALFLSGVLVDRTRVNRAGVVAALLRWRARVRTVTRMGSHPPG
ncbi:MAG: VWA domain-containing protein [Rubrivivax sp.]|nr:VWA domain-containing protein [Rubrivivax sp.]